MTDLDTLRKRARFGRGLWALGLLAAVLTGLTAGPVWALIIAALFLPLYLAAGRKDYIAYRDACARILLSTDLEGVLTDWALAPKNAIPRAALEQDALLPGALYDKCAVRYGAADAAAQLADLALPVHTEFEQGGTGLRVHTGVYVRFPIGAGALWTAAGDASPLRATVALGARGQHVHRAPGCTVWSAAPAGLSPAVCSFLEKIFELSGAAVIGARNGMLCAFLPGQYLNPGEPDYSRVPTPGAARIPALRLIAAAAAALR